MAPPSILAQGALRLSFLALFDHVHCPGRDVAECWNAVAEQVCQLLPLHAAVSCCSALPPCEACTAERAFSVPAIPPIRRGWQTRSGCASTAAVRVATPPWRRWPSGARRLPACLLPVGCGPSAWPALQLGPACSLMPCVLCSGHTCRDVFAAGASHYCIADLEQLPLSPQTLPAIFSLPGTSFLRAPAATAWLTWSCWHRTLINSRAGTWMV